MSTWGSGIHKWDGSVCLGGAVEYIGGTAVCLGGAVEYIGGTAVCV